MLGQRQTPRVVRLSAKFRRRLEAIGIRPYTAEHQAIGATISALAEAKSLPGVLDTIAAVPPTSRAFVRRVPGRNVWIWYRATAHELVCVTATRSPPMPLDD